MSAAAAAAWVGFVGAATAAACGPGGGCGLPVPDMAQAVDGVTAQGLAPLVPAQLLVAATAALQARLAQLSGTLAAVFEAPEPDGGGFGEEHEAALAETLRVCGAQRGRPRGCSAQSLPARVLWASLTRPAPPTGDV